MRRATPIALAGWLLLACSGPSPSLDLVLVAVPTSNESAAEGAPCRLALLSGRLVAHATEGVAVQGSPDVAPAIVVWPRGFVAADLDGGRFLLDRTGRRVARVGDWVEAGGGLGAGDLFHVCGPVTVVPGR